MEKVSKPSKKIQKIVHEFTSLRQELAKARSDLFNVTEKIIQQRQDEEFQRMNAHRNFGAKSRLSISALNIIESSEKKPKVDPSSLTKDEKVVYEISLKHNLVFADALKVYMKFEDFDTDQSLEISRKEFIRFIRTISKKKFREQDFEKYWRIASKYKSRRQRRSTMNNGNAAEIFDMCAVKETNAELPLEQFMLWYMETDCSGLILNNDEHHETSDEEST